MALIIGKGAEATIYRDADVVIKDREQKSYRIAEIDQKLRRSRTRREAKVLQKLKDLNFPGPHFIQMDDKAMTINMAFIEGQQVKKVLSENPVSLSREIGQKLAILHQHDIIHGDLTTSNMILDKEIHFIDFGLSFFSSKIEDKACDLHLLRQALESKHHEIYEECFNAVLDGYQSYLDHQAVIKKLQAVEERGRNKKKS